MTASCGFVASTSAAGGSAADTFDLSGAPSITATSWPGTGLPRVRSAAAASSITTLACGCSCKADAGQMAATGQGGAMSDDEVLGKLDDIGVIARVSPDEARARVATHGFLDQYVRDLPEVRGTRRTLLGFARPSGTP